MSDLEKIIEWTKEVRTMPGEVKVDLTKHIPTANELNNMLYLPCKYIVGHQMRACDIQMMSLFSPGKTVVEMVEHIGDFVWDHLMGEPDDMQDAVHDAVLALVENLFKMDEKVRNDV